MVNIIIAGHDDFPCPVGWTVALAEERIRVGYGLLNGFIRKNGEAMASSDIITADGDYHFVNFQSGSPGNRFDPLTFICCVIIFALDVTAQNLQSLSQVFEQSFQQALGRFLPVRTGSCSGSANGSATADSKDSANTASTVGQGIIQVVEPTSVNEFESDELRNIVHH